MSRPEDVQGLGPVRLGETLRIYAILCPTLPNFAILCASGEPEQKSQSFAKIIHEVRWQDRHCYVAMQALRATLDG